MIRVAVDAMGGDTAPQAEIAGVVQAIDALPGQFVVQLVGRLEVISEELADLAIVRLRESIDAGGAELPVDERRLTRARRAVERAAGILAEPDDEPD